MTIFSVGYAIHFPTTLIQRTVGNYSTRGETSHSIAMWKKLIDCYFTLYSAKLFKRTSFHTIFLAKVSEKNSCYALLEKSLSILGHFNS